MDQYLARVDALQFPERQRVEGVDRPDERAFQLTSVDGAREEPQPRQGVDHIVVVAAYHSKKHTPDVFHHRRGNLAYHAEIDQHHDRTGLHKDVSRVRVGVKEAILQDLLQVSAHQDFGYGPAADGPSLELLEIRHLGSGHALQTQHTPCRARPVHPRNANIGDSTKHVRETFGVMGFLHVVKFQAKGDFKLSENLGQIGASPHGCVAVEPANDVAKAGKIGLNDLRNPRPLHLDDHALAGHQRGGMDLSQRRRGQWYRVEPTEDRLDRPAELRFDYLAHIAEGYARHFILQ